MLYVDFVLPKLQVNASPELTLADGMVYVLPTKLPTVAPALFLQLAVDNTQSAGMEFSLMVMSTPNVFTVYG